MMPWHGRILTRPPGVTVTRPADPSDPDRPPPQATGAAYVPPESDVTRQAREKGVHWTTLVSKARARRRNMVARHAQRLARV